MRRFLIETTGYFARDANGRTLAPSGITLTQVVDAESAALGGALASHRAYERFAAEPRVVPDLLRVVQWHSEVFEEVAADFVIDPRLAGIGWVTIDEFDPREDVDEG